MTRTDTFVFQNVDETSQLMESIKDALEEERCLGVLEVPSTTDCVDSMLLTLRDRIARLAGDMAEVTEQNQIQSSAHIMMKLSDKHVAKEAELEAREKELEQRK